MNAILTVLKFLPMIFSVVRAIEAAMPDSPGKQKLDAALNFIMSAEEQLRNAAPAVTAAVNGIVAAYNASGVFTKSTPA